MKTIWRLLSLSSDSPFSSRLRTAEEQAEQIDRLRAIIPVSYIVMFLMACLASALISRWETDSSRSWIAVVGVCYIFAKSARLVFQAKKILKLKNEN